jgi:hypothetical protein
MNVVEVGARRPKTIFWINVFTILIPTTTRLFGKGKIAPNIKEDLQEQCAARAFCDCPAIISLRPRSQNISKEPHLNPEEDSRRKRPDRM